MQASILGQDIETGQLVTLENKDRESSLYLIGRAGSGKTTLLVNLILQSIEEGYGLCFLDPHEDATTEILKRLPPEREHDVILLDLTDNEYAFGLNLFQCNNPSDEIEISRVTSMIMGVFAKLFTESGDLFTEAPNMAKTLLNTIPVLLSHTNPHMTMAEIPLLFTHDDARAKLLQPVTNMQVHLFWKMYDGWRSDRQQDLTDSTNNRVDNFLTNPLLFKIIGQSETTLNFRHIMDSNKIVLVKLSNTLQLISNLIGSIIVGQLANAAFSRVDTPEQERIPFFLYVDEFQNFATSTFAQILAETRKYKLFPVIAHQYRGQLTKQNRDATLNAMNKVVFQVSGDDAQELAYVFDCSPVPGGEPRKEPIRTPHAKVIDWLLGGHSQENRIINNFIKQWQLEQVKENTQDTSEWVQQPDIRLTELDPHAKPIRDRYGHWLPEGPSEYAFENGKMKKYLIKKGEKEWVKRSGQPYREFLEIFNDVLFRVMRDGNPYQPLPFRLFFWRAINIMEYKSIHAVDEGWEFSYQLPNGTLNTYHLRNYFVGLLASSSEQANKLYTDFWTARDEKRLITLFSEYEQLVREYVKAQLERNIQKFQEIAEKIAIERRRFNKDTHNNELITAQEKYTSLEYFVKIYGLGSLGLSLPDVDGVPVHVQHTERWEERLDVTSLLLQPGTARFQPEVRSLTTTSLTDLLRKTIPDLASFYLDVVTIDKQDVRKTIEEIILFIRDHVGMRYRQHRIKVVQQAQVEQEITQKITTWGELLRNEYENNYYWSRFKNGTIKVDTIRADDASTWMHTFQDSISYALETVAWSIRIDEWYTDDGIKHQFALENTNEKEFRIFLARSIEKWNFRFYGNCVKVKQLEADMKVGTALQLPLDTSEKKERFLQTVTIHPSWQKQQADKIRAEIDRIVTEQKDAFEKVVREIRALLQAFAKEPITNASGLMQEIPVEVSSAEVAARIANKLANPAHKYTARVKLVDGNEHIIRPDVTDVFRPADAPSLVQARLKHIGLRNYQEGYTREKEEVKQEITARQDELMKRVQRQSRVKTEEDENEPSTKLSPAQQKKLESIRNALGNDYNRFINDPSVEHKNNLARLLDKDVATKDIKDHLESWRAAGSPSNVSPFAELVKTLLG